MFPVSTTPVTISDRLNHSVKYLNLRKTTCVRRFHTIKLYIICRGLCLNCKQAENYNFDLREVYSNWPQ